jgi:hypothetical protein
MRAPAEWLARSQEKGIFPDQRIVDPHHHLWTWLPYGIDRLSADLQGGHRVVATVYIESHDYYDPKALPHLKSVGETASIRKIAEKFSETPGQPDIMAGIVASVNLLASDRQ